MLYIFAGCPLNTLNAGGVQHAVETVLELAILEHDPNIIYKKEGIFIGPNAEEWLAPADYCLSAACLNDGITWDWFNENWSFGNGVTVHKTSANYEYKTVVHGTDLGLDAFLRRHGPTLLADLKMSRGQSRHEGWQKYAARWLPGTCPKESHEVYLTWLITTHTLAPFAYDAIRELIEVDIPVDRTLYEDRHFSPTRRYTNAVS
jgi:hypothetical protein